jgi:hypothetical protein
MLCSVAEPKTFVTSVFAGHRAAGLPFGRFEVSDDRLTARSWPRGRWIRRSIAKKDITAVRVTLVRRVTRIRVEDAAEEFGGVLVESPFRGRRILVDLRQRGYPVADLR